MTSDTNAPEWPTPRPTALPRFSRIVLDEFFRIAFRTKFYEAVEALQANMDEWLVYCNTERSHQGYRNMGRRPIETINLYLQSVPREG